ncbi:MAG TPA: protein YgfX [Rhodanobacteraceae bacterium]|nr:protein YgfX [Rhodanobacteraceae bacterium]
MRSAPDISFELKPSPSELALLAAVTVLALIGAWGADLDGLTRLALAAVVLVVAGAALRRRLRPPLVAVRWRGDGEVRVTLRDGSEVEATLRGRSWGPLIVLALAWRGRRLGLWLWPDQLDADGRRRLRMRLSATADAH